MLVITTGLNILLHLLPEVITPTADLVEGNTHLCFGHFNAKTVSLSTAENGQIRLCEEVQTHFPVPTLQCGRGERQDSHPREKEGAGTCQWLRPSQVEKGSKQVTLSGTEQQGEQCQRWETLSTAISHIFKF